jgi:MATE family multidrug resistance protein
MLFGAVSLAKPLMHLMGQSPEVIELAGPYVDWVAFSLIPVVIFQGYKQFADGMSLTKYDMYTVVASNLIHIPINYVLIYGVWFFPKMGIMGAAVGTLISRVFMVLYMHWLLSRDSKLKHYFHGFSFKKIKVVMLKKIVSIGLPSSLQMFFEVALFTAAVWLAGSLSRNSQAANQIALSFASMTFMVAMGLSVAAMVRVGNQKGQRDYKQLLVVARSIFFLAIILETIFALLFVALHNYLPHLFLNMENAAQLADNSEVIAIASQLLIVAAVFQLSDGLQVVVLGALRGIQDVKVPAVITFVAYWVIGFPTSWYLSKVADMGAMGIWIGLLAGLTAAAIFLYLRFNYLTKKMIKEGDNSLRRKETNFKS